jgi:hypothetical protein
LELAELHLSPPGEEFEEGVPSELLLLRSLSEPSSEDVSNIGDVSEDRPIASVEVGKRGLEDCLLEP